MLSKGTRAPKVWISCTQVMCTLKYFGIPDVNPKILSWLTVEPFSPSFQPIKEPELNVGQQVPENFLYQVFLGVEPDGYHCKVPQTYCSQICLQMETYQWSRLDAPALAVAEVQLCPKSLVAVEYLALYACQ